MVNYLNPRKGTETGTGIDWIPPPFLSKLP